MERCPVCRARLDDPVCRRCGSDFRVAARIETQARERLREALHLCRLGHLETAMQLLGDAWRLKRDPGLGHLLDTLIHVHLQQGFHCLSQGDLAEALRLCRKILKARHVPLALALQSFIRQRYFSEIAGVGKSLCADESKKQIPQGDSVRFPACGIAENRPGASLPDICATRP